MLSRGGREMELRSGGLFKKDILCIDDGCCLGRADELLLEYRTADIHHNEAHPGTYQPGTAQVHALVVRGRPRLFGLLGREPDLLIDWSDVLVIGEDAILIHGRGREVDGGGGLFGTHPFREQFAEKLPHS